MSYSNIQEYFDNITAEITARSKEIEKMEVEKKMKETKAPSMAVPERVVPSVIPDSAESSKETPREMPCSVNTYALLRISQLAEETRQTGLALSDDEDQCFTSENLMEIGESLSDKSYKISRLVIELLKSYNSWSEDEARELVVKLKKIN